jgi:hypothetical protein
MLTKGDCRTLLECLGYSIRHIQDHPHQQESHKNDSLKPLIELRDKLRAMRDQEVVATGLTPDQRSLLRGRRYNQIKKDQA